MVLDDVSMLIVMAWVNTRSFSCPHNIAVAEIISEITLLFSCPCFFKKCFIHHIYFALTFHLKMQVHECNNTLWKNVSPHCVPLLCSIHDSWNKHALVFGRVSVQGVKSLWGDFRLGRLGVIVVDLCYFALFEDFSL